jgi:hypothetical protein
MYKKSRNLRKKKIRNNPSEISDISLKPNKKKNILTIPVRRNLKKESKKKNFIINTCLFFDVARNFNDTLCVDQSEMTRADKRTSPRDPTCR